MVRGGVPRRARHAAGGDRARSRRDGRSAARAAGGAVLSRLLSGVLLPAAVHLCGRLSPGGEAAAGGRGRRGRGGGGSGPDRRAGPAAGAGGGGRGGGGRGRRGGGGDAVG